MRFVLLSTIAIVLIFVLALLASSPTQTHANSLFGASQERVKIIVVPRDSPEFSGVVSSSSSSSSSSTSNNMNTDMNNNINNIVPLGLANGSRYRCLIPGRSTHHDDGLLWRRHLARMRDQPLPEHMLSSLNAALSELCFTQPAGWWTYKLCWGRALRQFHADSAGKVETEYVLGEGPLKHIEDGALPEILYDVDPADRSKGRLYAEWFNGTTCDLTGEQRQMQLLMYCPVAPGSGTGGGGGDQQTNHHSAGKADGSNNEAYQLSVVEPSSCQYQVTLRHPAFCRVAELKQREQPAVEVKCVEVAQEVLMGEEENGGENNNNNDRQLPPQEEREQREEEEEAKADSLSSETRQTDSKGAAEGEEEIRVEAGNEQTP